ncbi:polysaccharide biosynthesis protein [Acinetobacter sp. AG1]|uniref:oligosaccharide flippase family protein n=1 Tax=Acinetobacter TaxID=469 RepID=UPI0006296612|nr:oligosaccharide flippase family protein [Acinetobacter sp. AG1]KKW82389.1 polysaccharide biosynthesis protein [Acinetobacter sp. AG1]
MDKKKILAYAIGPVGSGIFSVATLPIITWFYNVDDVGRISMLQIFTSFAILFFCLGLDQSYVRAYHDSDNKPLLLKHAMFPGVCICILSCLLIFIYKPDFISKILYSVESVYLSFLTFFCFIVALISRFLSLTLRMQERAIAFSMSQVLPKILLLLFVISAVVWAGSRDSKQLFTANALALFIACLIFAWNTRNDWIPAFAQKFDKIEFQTHLSYGFPLLIGGLASWGLNVSDRIFLRLFSSYTDLGVYSVAMSIASAATIFATIFNTIWAPLVFKWVSSSEIDLKKIDDISEYILMAIYFIVVVAGLFSWLLDFILPNQYLSVKYLIIICIIGPLFYTLSEVTGIGIAIAKKTRFSMYASIAAMLTSIVLNFFLVKKLGALGAAISTAFSFWFFYILRTEFSQLVWRKTIKLRGYLITFSILLISSIYSLLMMSIGLQMAYWGMFLILGMFIFKREINSILNLFKRRR